MHYQHIKTQNAKSALCKEDKQMYESAAKRVQKYIIKLKPQAEQLESELITKLHHSGIPKIQIDYDFKYR